jgi:hypothetical protein
LKKTAWKTKAQTDDIKMYFKETVGEGMDWIHLLQYRKNWWVLVNMVTNFWIPKMWGISHLDEDLTRFSRRLLL